MSGLTRKDELRLKALTEKQQEKGSLSEDDDLVLSYLQQRYDQFLEEGLRKLREGSPQLENDSPFGRVSRFFSKTLSSSPQRKVPNISSPSVSEAFPPVSPPLPPCDPPPGFNDIPIGSTSIAGPGGARSAIGAPFLSHSQALVDSAEETFDALSCTADASICEPAAPMAGGPPEERQQFGAHEGHGGKHWTWVGENLIFGAVPFAGKCGDKTAHLHGLSADLKLKGLELALVVSCLEIDELQDSADACEFAQPKDWERVMHVPCFVHLTLPKDPNEPIEVPLEDTLQVCSQIYNTLHAPESPRPVRGARMPNPGSRNKVVFVHCKAGNTRCWVPLMCYLTSQCCVGADEAAGLLQELRPSMRPSAVHRAYVNRFVDFIAVPLARKRDDAEEAYSLVLAQILSLPSSFRVRLLKDLEKLT